MAEQPELRSRLAEIPHQPGIYLMKDRFGSVIYVGKAASLRDRVRSYFLASTDLGPRKQPMLALIEDIDVLETDAEWEALLAEADARGLGHRIEHLGFVSRERVYRLYRQAEALTFPSRFEGFGLPLLEARARDTPVRAARGGAGSPTSAGTSERAAREARGTPARATRKASQFARAMVTSTGSPPSYRTSATSTWIKRTTPPRKNTTRGAWTSDEELAMSPEPRTS